MGQSWKNLNELREWALSQGFSPEQFGYAIDHVGSDPQHVGDELQRHLSRAALYEGLSKID